jgi:sialate O-acetylesterase
VAYFAAEQLHKELGVPIGIIHSSLGGSKVQVWTSREALVAGGEDPNETFRGKTSTYLYNGMVYPLRNASFRSVLWFQGEQNMDDAEKYDKLYALMTSSWRKLFQRDDLKFYFVTLNGYKPPDPDPNAVAVQPRIRASQQRTELADPLSHMAVGADTGEALDVHARDKRPIGERLAKLVLKYDFGRDIVADSPIFKSASRNGAEVTVTFDRVGSGLVAHPVKTEYVTQGRRANEKYTRCSPDSQLEDFALRDAAGNWHWADDAHIVGRDSVVVSSKAVPSPAAIRYAYRGFPMGNIYNEEGFPAAQFDVELK